MALSSHVGSFTAPETSGTLAVTGVGFQPKAIIITGIGGTGDERTDFSRYMIGVAASPTQQFVNTIRSSDGGTVRRGHSGAHCLAILSSSAWFIRASLSSFDADGFTLDFDTTSSGTRTFNYLALGGDDLENAFVGHQEFDFGNASASVTGVGFQPNLILMPGSTGSFNTTDERASGTASIGAAISSAVQFSAGVSRSSGSAETSHARLENDATTLRLGLTTGSLFETTALDSFDADGFTITLGGSSTGSARYGFLCLRITNVHIGTFDQPSSTGTQSVTGVGFEPQALVTFTRHKDSAAGVEPLILGTGLADGSVNNHSVTIHWESSTNNVLERQNGARFIDSATHDGTTVTGHAIANLQSLDADGFTLDWTTADATAREHVYVAMGGGDEPAQDTFGPFNASDFSIGDRLHQVLPFTVQPGDDDTVSYWEVAERDGRQVWRWSGGDAANYTLDDAGGSVGDAEILMSAIHADGASNDVRIYGIFRDTSVDGTSDYYRAGMRNNSDTHTLVIEKWTSSTFTSLFDSADPDHLAPNTWGRIRASVSGTTVFTSVWEETEDEVNAETASVEDSDHTAGRIGIGPGTATTDIYDVEWFSFGINGATAPEPAVTSVTVTISAVDINNDPIPDQTGVSAWIWSDRSTAAVVKTGLEIAGGDLVIDVEGDGFADQEEVFVMAELSSAEIATAIGTVVES